MLFHHSMLIDLIALYDDTMDMLGSLREGSTHLYFDNSRTKGENLASKINLSPWWLWLMSILTWWCCVVDSLFSAAPIV